MITKDEVEHTKKVLAGMDISKRMICKIKNHLFSKKKRGKRLKKKQTKGKNRFQNFKIGF